MLEGGADAILVETCQDLLQLKAAVLGSRRAMAQFGRHIPVFAHVTVETTGTMLLGSEIGAALTAVEPLGVDMIGLNCATGPAEMSEHLRYLSQHAQTPVSVMPNAGLPVLGAKGAEYPLQPDELAEALSGFVSDYGLSLVGGCCGTTPEHIRRVAEAIPEVQRAERHITFEPAVASLYSSTPFHQDASVLMIGERTNANGSKAFREAMIAEDWQKCLDIAKDQTRDGAHLLDLCVDYVGRDGVADMNALASRLATASTLPIMLDSTETPVLRAGLEHLGGRCAINSVNYEDGDGPESRFTKTMELVSEHGAAVVALTIDEEGQARTAEKKVEIAERLIADITGNWGVDESSILIDTLTFTICTGQEESRKDGLETIEAIRLLKQKHPDVQTTLGLSNISFGLNPAARQVLNSVFLHECQEAGLDSAIVHASKILPMNRIDEKQREVALDLVYDRRREGYDPLQELMGMFEGVSAASSKESRAAELAKLPLLERLAQRIVDGERNGLDADLDEAMTREAAARDHQREPAGRHEDRRRTVRLRPDAAAVRAAVRRGDESRCGVPGTAHGEGRRRRGQGPDRAGDREGRRARHRQEPRRHHPDQQRLRGGQHRHQAADQHHPRGRRGQERRRGGHVRAAGEVDRGDEGKPPGDEHPRGVRQVPGAARRRRTDPQLRGERSRRGLPGRSALRA